jgi:hypothetical protein
VRERGKLTWIEPGGYLQWIEPDISASKAISPWPDICSEASEALMRDAVQFLRDFKISYEYVLATSQPLSISLRPHSWYISTNILLLSPLDDSWLHVLPATCKNLGMTNVRQYKPPPIEAIRPIFAYGTVGAYEEFSYSILDKYGPTPSLGSGDDLRKRLDIIRGEMDRGVAFEQPIYVLVARKALEG